MDYDDIRTQINASTRHLQAQAEMLQEQLQANEYLYELLDRISQLERDNADLQREVRNGEQIIASTASLLNTSRLECAQAKEELAKLKLRLAEEGLPIINNINGNYIETQNIHQS